ncbi:chromatin assembly factor 1 subunit A [Pelodytes ibericus]
MPGDGGLGEAAETLKRRSRSPAVVKSSRGTTSKKMVQARLPFKRMNPVPKDKEGVLDKKKVKINSNIPRENNLHLLNTSTDDLENDCQMETEVVHPFPKAVNGRGPLDNYLRKTSKVNLLPSTHTIDLTEDSNSSHLDLSPLNGEMRTLLPNRSSPQKNVPKQMPSMLTNKCIASMKTMAQQESTELSEPCSKSPETLDLQKLSESEDNKVLVFPNISASKQSLVKSSESSEEDDSPPPSSTCSPISVGSLESQASLQEKNTSPSEVTSPVLKVILHKVSTEKKRLSKDKDQEEKRKKLQVEREDKERAKEEAKAAKDRVKEEARKKKDEEREQKEKEKREKKEREDREKAEKLRLKEEKKREKLEALEAKQEEKRKKEEEKRMKEEEKRMKAEKAEITRFLQKSRTPKMPKTFASSCGKFAPFEIKKNMAVAPLCRVEFEPEASDQLDMLLQNQNCEFSFLAEIKARKPRRMGRTLVPRVSILSSEVDDVQILEDPSTSMDEKFMHEEPVSQANVPERQRFGRMKLLQFCENYRPAYWGTWNRMSQAICPRKPWAQDTKLLDYEADSDEEWEEEEPGESLSHSEGDDDDEPKEEEEEDDDGFFVPHGYLSEDEGGASDEDLACPENHKVRQRLKAKEWDELQSKGKKFRVLQPVVIGCLWQDGSTAESRLLQRFAACILESPLAEEEQAQEASSSRKLKDRKILSQLLPLLHGNVNGSKIIIHEYQECCRQGMFSEAESSITTKGVATSPNSTQQAANITVPSKACLKRIISENSVYEKRPEHRMCWYVHSEVLKSFEKEHLPVPCQWTYLTPVNSSKEDCGTSVGSVQTTPVSSKRKSAGSMPIMKFMKRAKDLGTGGAMEIDGFQADTEEEEDDCIIVEKQQVKDMKASTACNLDISSGDAAVPAVCQA